MFLQLLNIHPQGMGSLWRYMRHCLYHCAIAGKGNGNVAVIKK